MAKWVSLVYQKRSYQNNAYEVTSWGVVVHPDRVLVKTSTQWQ